MIPGLRLDQFPVSEVEKKSRQKMVTRGKQLPGARRIVGDNIRTCVDRILINAAQPFVDGSASSYQRHAGLSSAFLSEGIGEDTKRMTEQSSNMSKKGIDFIRKNYMKDIKVARYESSASAALSYEGLPAEAIFLSPQNIRSISRRPRAAYLLKNRPMPP